jgi:hypothetical protein
VTRPPDPAAGPAGGAAPPARRRGDAARILLRIAGRNLVASRARTLIIGLIVLVGSLIVVVGASVMDSIDRGMRTSIQGSLGGQLQVFNRSSEGQLELYGGLRGESLLDPIEDFARVKEVLLRVPNVRMVVPMGIDQAMVSTGNAFDVALEKLRADTRRVQEGDRGPEALRAWRARQAHLRRMVNLLSEELAQARVLVDRDGPDWAERQKQRAQLDRAVAPAFLVGFEAVPLQALEFLENRVAPLAMDSAFTFIRYVGTDVDAFMKAFELAEIASGTTVPPGQRGILLGKQYAEEWLKLKNARRLDQIKDARDRFRRTLAEDEELQRWKKELQSRSREILLQLDPLQVEVAEARLRPALGAPAGEDLPKLLARLFDVDDGNFDQRHDLFYRELAPLLRLYQISVGDTITIKAPGKTGAFNSVAVKVYGFLQFRGIEKSGIAGTTSVMDLQSFRDLYGYLTKDKAEELARMRAAEGARQLTREEAEAALFGGDAPLTGQARQADIDEGALLAGVADKRQASEAARGRVYSQEEIDRGVALNAAILLHDPRRLGATGPAIRRPPTPAWGSRWWTGRPPPASWAVRHRAAGGALHLGGDLLRHRPGHHQQRHGDGGPPAGEGDRHHAGHRGAAPLRGGAAAGGDRGGRADLRPGRRRPGRRGGGALAGRRGHPGLHRPALLPLLRAGAPAAHGRRQRGGLAPAGAGRLGPLRPLPGPHRHAGHARRGDGLRRLRIRPHAPRRPRHRRPQPDPPHPAQPLPGRRPGGGDRPAGAAGRPDRRHRVRLARVGHHPHDRPRQRGRLLQGDQRLGRAAGLRLPQGAGGHPGGRAGARLLHGARPGLGQGGLPPASMDLVLGGWTSPASRRCGGCCSPSPARSTSWPSPTPCCSSRGRPSGSR